MDGTGPTREESMRTPFTRTLGATAVAAAALLAVAGTASTAYAAGKLPTTLTATDSKATIVLGQTDLITGTLKSGSTPLVGQTVHLDRSIKGKFVPVQVDKTGGAGHVFFTVKPAETASYELVYAGTANFAASHSNIVTVVVVKPSKSPTTLTATEAKTIIDRGQTDLITGTLLSGTKPVPGQHVYLESFVKGKLVPRQHGTTGGAGHVFYTVKPSATTSYELVYLGTAKFDAAHSNVITVVVIRAPTSLTATESKTTIAPGQTDQITGTLLSGTKAVPGQVVFLERLISGKWVNVQVALTGGAGHVFFTVKPSKTSSYELAYHGTAFFAPSHSNVVTVVVS
jgi:hypothetical protein